MWEFCRVQAKPKKNRQNREEGKKTTHTDSETQCQKRQEVELTKNGGKGGVREGLKNVHAPTKNNNRKETKTKLEKATPEGKTVG